MNIVPIIMIDNLFLQEGIKKAYIKIDVEGGELSVIIGMKAALKEDLIIAMEYLFPGKGSAPHQKAAALLYEAGYKSHLINDDGTLSPVDSIDQYLQTHSLTSDNIIFRKT